jgi:hypothetical protein
MTAAQFIDRSRIAESRGQLREYLVNQRLVVWEILRVVKKSVQGDTNRVARAEHL